MDEGLEIFLIVVVMVVSVAIMYTMYLLSRYMFFSATSSRTAHQPEVPDEHKYKSRMLQDPTAEQGEDLEKHLSLHEDEVLPEAEETEELA
mmetsp:Transcript_24985/g.44427  ORF Transcript_24985/g.44427 Transcript_24985/m.44427 type:complete len:91 (-) Transcript_24985:307-579(-)